MFNYDVIGMAWRDRISFDEIKKKTGLNEKEVIKLMRKKLKKSSYILWRKRVRGRVTKHRKLFKSRFLNYWTVLFSWKSKRLKLIISFKVLILSSILTVSINFCFSSTEKGEIIVTVLTNWSKLSLFSSL